MENNPRADEPLSGKKIALSLSSCLDIGLANNLDIKIAKIDAKIGKEAMPLARSVFDTIITGKTSYEDDQRAQASSIYGSKSLTADYEMGLSSKLPSGTEFGVNYSDERTWTDSAFVTNNPLHTAELSVTATQPLVRNSFGYVDRRNVKLSKIESEIADIESLGRIETAVADIEKAYWELVFAHQNVSLRKELLGQSEYLYEIFRRHIETGFAESTELFETEANMRIKKTEFDIAENELVTANNNLKLLLNVEGDFLIAPRNILEIYGENADLAESLKEALSSNRNYLVKKKELESKKITLKMKENSLWPEVDLVGTLAVNGVDRKFESANRVLSTNKHPMYYAGIEISVPLENREAIGEYNKANLEKEKAILAVVDAEKSLMTDVDEKVRRVNLNLENTKRWRKIKKLQHKKFEDEGKKLRYGRSGSKTLIDYQNDFINASLNEYTAILDYYRALIDLENTKDTLLAKVGVLEK